MILYRLVWHEETRREKGGGVGEISAYRGLTPGGGRGARAIVGGGHRKVYHPEAVG